MTNQQRKTKKQQQGVTQAQRNQKVHFQRGGFLCLRSVSLLKTFFLWRLVFRFLHSGKWRGERYQRSVHTRFSCVQRRSSGSTTYKVQPRRHHRREYGRHGEPCNWSQDCVKHAYTGRQRLSLASALLLPDRTRETVLLDFPSSRNRFSSTFLVMPKDCFPKIPLCRWTTHLHVTCWYQCSIRGCSKQILGDLTLKIPTERVSSTARTCKLKLRFYIENKPEKLFDFRSALPYGYPSSEVSCMNFVLAFEALLLHKGKLSVCSSRMHHLWTNRTRGHDEARRR